MYFSIKLLKAFRVFGLPNLSKVFYAGEEHVRKPTETNLQTEKLSMFTENCLMFTLKFILEVCCVFKYLKRLQLNSIYIMLPLDRFHTMISNLKLPDSFNLNL